MNTSDSEKETLSGYSADYRSLNPKKPEGEKPKAGKAKKIRAKACASYGKNGHHGKRNGN